MYAPTWHATKDSTELMSISPELIEEYHVIFKGHIEDDMTLPEGAIEAPNHIETQDLLLISDVVITDYSSIIFDALTIGKSMSLYTKSFIISARAWCLMMLWKVYLKFGIQMKIYYTQLNPSYIN